MDSRLASIREEREYSHSNQSNHAEMKVTEESVNSIESVDLSKIENELESDKSPQYLRNSIASTASKASKFVENVKAYAPILKYGVEQTERVLTPAVNVV